MTYQGTPNLEEFYAVWDRFLCYKSTLSRVSMHMGIMEEIEFCHTSALPDVEFVDKITQVNNLISK